MDAFFVMLDAQTGNTSDHDEAPHLTPDSDVYIDAIWVDANGDVQYGEIDVFVGGYSGSEYLAQILGVGVPGVNVDLPQPDFSELEFEVF